MELKIKKIPWPKDFEINTRDFRDGISGITKGKADKVRDNTDRFTAILDYSVTTLNGVLYEMEKLIKQMDPRKIKVNGPR